MKYQKILAGMMVATVMMMTGCSTYNPVQLRQHQLERNYTYYLKKLYLLSS